MSDVATPVESSAPAPVVAEAVHNFEPSTYTPEEYKAYMAKGELPKAKADPPPAQAVAPESTAGTQQEHKGKDRSAEGRIRELLAENKALKEAKANPDVPAAPSPAPKAVKPIAPKFGEKEGENWEQFEARQAEHVTALVKYELANEREANEKQRREADTAAANKQIEDAWNSRLETAKSAHSDYAEVAFSKELPISPVMDGFILDSEHGPEILYYLGGHLDEGKAIAAMPPYRAARALVKIEASLSGEGEKPAEKPPVAAPITRAAKPAPDLRATNAAPVDERKAAIEADDFKRFSEIEDRKLLERRKKA